MAITVQKALIEATAALRAADIESATIDARALLAHVLGEGDELLVKDRDKPLNNADIQAYNVLVARRQQHEPIAHIRGKKEFWSLDFKVSPATLTPRPETETLIESALHWFPDRKADYRILDLGTGTGCLLITLLKELPQSTGIGIDISTDALAIAHANARALRVDTRARFMQSNWAAGIEEQFDIIVSNPPYIARRDMAALPKDVVGFEPHSALVAGEDGLDAYRALLPQVSKLLKERGIALFEIGQGQAANVSDIASKAGLNVAEIKPDLAGIDRCIILQRREG